LLVAPASVTVRVFGRRHDDPFHALWRPASARRPEGIFVAPFEQGEIGPDLFRAACKMGLEGLVSKRRDHAYRGGRCTHWIKVKNPASLAMSRAAEIAWSR
jgi:hypothetical protein